MDTWPARVSSYAACKKKTKDPLLLQQFAVSDEPARTEWLHCHQTVWPVRRACTCIRAHACVRSRSAITSDGMLATVTLDDLESLN
jgi:hypothetical protein